jgi:hypothetical protein
MQIERNYMSPGLVAMSGGASPGAAPTAATVGRSGSAVPESLRAVGVPVYSHTEVLRGSAIMLALCLVVLVALAVGWWRLRYRPGEQLIAWHAGSSVAELDGFHDEQHCADDEIATEGEHAESGAGRPSDGLQQCQRRHPPGGAVDSGDRV